MNIHRIFFPLGITLMLLCPNARADDQALPVQAISGTSPDGMVAWELRGDGEKSIWLFPPSQKEKAVKLSDTPGWGNLHVYFSPDSHWMVVQDGGASLGVDLRLFRRDQGAVFSELKDAAIGDKAEAFALKQNGVVTTEDILDHRYLAVVRWSMDSRTVLIRLSGKGSNKTNFIGIEGWLGIYDLGKGEFGEDIAQMNRGTVEVEKLGKP